MAMLDELFGTQSSMWTWSWGLGARIPGGMLASQGKPLETQRSQGRVLLHRTLALEQAAHALATLLLGESLLGIRRPSLTP